MLLTPVNHHTHGSIAFAIDNAAYASMQAGVAFDWTGYWRMLDRLKARGVAPMFVAVPDVPMNAAATRAQWDEHADRVSEYGWPLAFVAQNGCNPLQRDATPCNADWIFVGGDDAYKWTTMPSWCKGKWPVHVGRVNSVDGLIRCEKAGATSCDGTLWQRQGQHGQRMRDLMFWIKGRARRQADAQEILL